MSAEITRLQRRIKDKKLTSNYCHQKNIMAHEQGNEDRNGFNRMIIMPQGNISQDQDRQKSNRQSAQCHVEEKGTLG